MLGLRKVLPKSQLRVKFLMMIPLQVLVLTLQLRKNTEGSAISFPVSLSVASGRDITVSYTLADGTANHRR